jgi:hypothetical protein
MKQDFFKEVKQEKIKFFEDKDVGKVVKTGLIIVGSGLLLSEGIKLLGDLND